MRDIHVVAMAVGSVSLGSDIVLDVLLFSGCFLAVTVVVFKARMSQNWHLLLCLPKPGGVYKTRTRKYRRARFLLAI